ncbi:type II and III secretion system protein family protein [Tropicimonas sp.]|uniref:type II and III secretion system protein family protein n=1 Tax=Tropicimonas sp. TaxID=2067044 RepID=UPI003A8386DE
MSFRTLLRAGLIGLAMAGTVSSLAAHADTLRIAGGTVQRPLKIPMNRAVVVETDAAFAELSIANPGIADISTLSERSIYVLGKAPGRTTLTLLAPDGTLITNVEVQVTADVGELKERLREILPREGIEVRPANDGIVLSGTVSSAEALDRALDLAGRYAPDRVSNLMSVGGTQQVMMKVRFAEMSRQVSKRLGISMGVSGASGDVSFIGRTASLLNNSDTGGGFVAGANTAGALGLSVGGSDVQFAMLLEALEDKGFVRTLAEPNLTALSGQAASFLAGGEYPVPVAQDDDTVSVEFKPFGIVLNMTPRVTGENINLSLSAEVSQIDSSIGFTDSGFTVAGFSTRKTSTTVEMRDGESFAIAGLLQDDFQDMSSQVPWLGDVPVLGALFRSADYQRAQSELVIIVSAHLVTPTRGDTLALPTDRVRPPSEKQLFLHGLTAVTNRPVTGGPGEVARQDFAGSYGYVME